ncbi:MAG: proprotein convertase P-domain-containing protein [Sandaracinaceae bacterium]|nr:proprotein convertase P-domain-containing protein [Sandaracinaceae bacterium]
MNRALKNLALGSALLLPLSLPVLTRAQTYECEAPLGTNCATPINDAWFRFSVPTTTGVTTSSLIVLPGACDPSDTVVDVDLDVDILHPYVGDLELLLTHPDGTAVTLMYRPGVGAIDLNCPNDDLSVTFDDEDGVVATDLCETTIPAMSGELLPFNPLSAFDGKARNGVWTLTVRDAVEGQQGVLRGWTLRLPCVPDLPNVSFEVTDGVLYERGPDTTATITVVRTGDTSAALDVVYSVVGTATGADYEALSGEVTIPAGSASATVEILSVDDDLDEIDEVIVLRLVADASAYDVGAGDSATVTLIDGNGSEGDGGCGCSVRGSSQTPFGLMAFLALGLLVRRRRFRLRR